MSHILPHLLIPQRAHDKLDVIYEKALVTKYISDITQSLRIIPCEIVHGMNCPTCYYAENKKIQKIIDDINQKANDVTIESRKELSD